MTPGNAAASGPAGSSAFILSDLFPTMSASMHSSPLIRDEGQVPLFRKPS